jgi:teichuronic acid biosynthesis glycosyltransferase TuaC
MSGVANDARRAHTGVAETPADYNGSEAPTSIGDRTAAAGGGVIRLPRKGLVDMIEHEPGAEILVVTNMWPDEEWPVYGIFVKRQVESLRARGLRCDVIYVRGHISSRAYLVASLRFLLATLRWRRRYRLVHVHAGETALVARFFIGPPMIVSYCGDDVLGDTDENGAITRSSGIRAAVIRSHAALCRATITKSKEMHDRLPRWVRRTNTVLPNGVDETAFAPIDRASARETLGWDPDERVALFVATKPDIPRKRRRLAEASCAAASLQTGPIRLHVAGLVPPEEMPLLMSAADCLLHTSSLEGSPNVIKEALMCNLPVVATPSGDIPDLLEGVSSSYLCPADSEKIADALADFFSSPRRSNGRDRIEATLSSTAIASRLTSMYRDHAALSTPEPHVTR